MKGDTTDLFLLNNTGNKSRKVLIDTFVVREPEFNLVMSELKKDNRRSRSKNVLIVGLRGAGKTTLLHRARYAVEDDKILAEKFVRVMFSEEQYHITDLTTLWESVAQMLQENHSWDGVSDEVQACINEKGLDEGRLYAILDKAAVDRGISLILFFENINVFLGKLTQKEKELFRHRITQQHIVRVIATSTSYTDSRVDLSSSFFDFFRVIELKSLSKVECEKLLLKIGSLQGQREQIVRSLKTIRVELNL